MKSDKINQIFKVLSSAINMIKIRGTKNGYYDYKHLDF